MVLNLRQPSETESQTITALAENGFPMVTIYPEYPQLCSATVDNLGGVQKAVNHLIRAGHTRIACVGFDSTEIIEVRRCLDMYYQTLTQAGIMPEEPLVSFGKYDP